jgi:hypothetical protein
MRHAGPVGVVVAVVVDVAVPIVSPTFALCVSAPLVPVTANVKVPLEASDAKVTVRVEVAVPPEGGVTGPGRLIETPEGAVPNHEYVSVTGELNPFVEPTLMSDVPDSPGLMASELGLVPIEKSGVKVIVKVRVSE